MRGWIRGPGGFGQTAVVALAGVAVFGAVFWVSLPEGKKTGPHELFGLLHELTGTTGEMLGHTKQLSGEVDQVEGKLGQLLVQEQIIAMQQETGHRLAQELRRQEELTANGIALMEQILEQEQISVETTGRVTAKAGSLTGQVEQSASLLAGLNGPLGKSREQSAVLDGQMDHLIRELERSRQSFRFVGRLKDLLKQPPLPDVLPPLPSLPPVLPGDGTPGGGWPELPGGGLPELPGLPGLPALPGAPGSTEPTWPTVPPLPGVPDILPGLPGLPGVLTGTVPEGGDPQ